MLGGMSMEQAAAQVGSDDKQQFSRCLSDPKLIVARHVFSDSDDFCKKTLDVGE